MPDVHEPVQGYPHHYAGHEGAVKGAMPEGCKEINGAKYYVFPILASGRFDDKTPQGEDRVVIGETSTAIPQDPVSRTYCLCITHRNLDENQFRPCVETDD